MRDTAATLGISQDMLRRAVNVGFSGGEKKRNEILQMAVLQPRLAVLDETDSGLDIDALRIVADGVNRLRSPERAMIVITHYQRLLDYIVPDVVHVMAKGRVVKSGGKELALELEAKGYAAIPGGGGVAMNAEVRAIKTDAEKALAAAYEAARGRLPGKGALSRAARGRVPAIRAARPAAPARRGMEIYRPARADARSLSAGRAARCGGEGARQGRGRAFSPASIAGGWCSSTAFSRRNCPT